MCGFRRSWCLRYRGWCSCRLRTACRSRRAGWVDWLPQFGLGAVGGWFAALIYICCLGTDVVSSLAVRAPGSASRCLSIDETLHGRDESPRPCLRLCLCCRAAVRRRRLGSAVPVGVTQVMAAAAPAVRVQSSFVIMDPDTGRVVMSHNPDTPRSPASTIKTVTTFAALDMLGPAFIWRTRGRVALSAGVLDGDLILQGGGDPYITLERWWSFVQASARHGLEVDSRRHRHRQHRIFPAAGGSRRLRRAAESLIQRRAGRVDGQFPVDRLPRSPPNAETRRVDVIASPAARSISAIENHISASRRAAAAVQRQGGFSSCLARTGTGWFFPAPCPRSARRKALHACCCSRPPMRSAPSSSCGANRAARFVGKLRIDAEARRRQTALYLRLVEFGRDRAAYQ